MPMTNSIKLPAEAAGNVQVQIRIRNAGMPIVLLPYSSTRVTKIAAWPWVVSPEPEGSILRLRKEVAIILTNH